MARRPSREVAADEHAAPIQAVELRHPSQSQLPVVVLLLELQPLRPLVVDGGIIRGALGLALHDLAPLAYQALYEAPTPPYRMAFLAPRLKLVLIGHATQHATAVLQAAAHMARQGLGHQRVPVHLRAAFQDLGPAGERPLIRDGAWLGLPIPVRLGSMLSPRDPTGPWALHLDTPLFLKQSDRVVRDAPPFSVVLARAIERCSKMFRFGGEFPMLPAEVREAAAHVRLRAHACRWTEFERYSARQKQAMLIGGIRGVLHYGPAPQAALAWVRACTVLGLGGKLSFGLGEIRVREDGPLTGDEVIQKPAVAAAASQPTERVARPIDPKNLSRGAS
jgi:hypothetical protein